MDTKQMLQQTAAVEAISRELGIDAATAEAGATALLRQFSRAFKTPLPQRTRLLRSQRSPR